MADQPFVPLHLRPDEVIEDALRLLSGEIDWPVAAASVGGPDIAAAVAARLVDEGRGTAESAPAVAPARRRWTWSPARRALVVAIIVLLAFAALVGAGGLGLPGLRILFGGPSPSPSAPTASPSAARRRPAVRRRRSRASRRRRSPARSGPPRPARPEPGSVSGRRSPSPTSTRGQASMSSGRWAPPSACRTPAGWTRPSTTRWPSCGPPPTGCRRRRNLGLD